MTKNKLIVCCLSLALLFGMFPIKEMAAAKKVSLSSKKITIQKGKSKTLTVKNTKKKVKWKILSGKKVISLKKKGKVAATIKGTKAGMAKVQATVGTKKLTCNVTVKDVKKTVSELSNTPAPSSPAATSAPTNAPASASPASTPASTEVPGGSHEQDVAALKALIADQRSRGATVSEDINAEGEYQWEDGRLVEIYWNAKGLTGDIDLSEFTALRIFECGFLEDYDETPNQITGLDVTKNVALEWLNCGRNQLTSLDVSKNVELVWLSCDFNQLTSLDVTNNTALQVLYCYDNQLTSLDITKNVALGELGCGGNQLSSLDVTKNVALWSLNCCYNQLTSLDVTKSVKLEWLKCYNNQLTSLDVSKNTALEGLDCSSNQLTSLDVSNNTALTSLDCDSTVTVIGYDK